MFISSENNRDAERIYCTYM